MACDLTKLCGMDAYCPLDNSARFSAAVNDDGWESSLHSMVKPKAGDVLLAISVGGCKDGISRPLSILAYDFQYSGAEVCAVVGREGGYLLTAANVAVHIKSQSTLIVEGAMSVVLHAIVSQMLTKEPLWESRS
jgi:phosphoheptose isomerase